VRLDVGIPAPVLVLADGRAVRPVWVNELGGITFEIGAEDGRFFVKWAPAGSGLDLAAEAARLSWAVAFTPVPRLFGQGADRTGSWLVTSALAGEMAVTARWKAEPYTAVAAIGAGLRAMHGDPAAGCVRRRPGPGAHPLLPPALGPRPVTAAGAQTAAVRQRRTGR
jgi:kanamycin kinase